MTQRIYVGNLAFEATEDDLCALFAPHGDVAECHVVLDRDTGRGRGFAFLEMGDTDAAKAIAALDGTEHQGRALKVNQARPRNSR